MRLTRRAARPQRCPTPACDHVRAHFPAPRHMLAARPCAAVDWWYGCVAHLAGVCQCPGCGPRPVDGPSSGCGCPADEPAGLV